MEIYTKADEVFEQIHRFKTTKNMVLLEKKLWYYIKNYWNLIKYGENYGTMKKKLWYYSKRLLIIINKVYQNIFIR